METRQPPALHPATAADLPAIEAFLGRHAHSSMFLLGNLRDHGLDERAAPHGMRVMLARAGGGRIAGVFGLTNNGFALFQAPGAGPALWQGFAAWLAGRTLAGFSGEAAQVARLRAALALAPDDLALEAEDPLYHLALPALNVPAALHHQVWLRPPEPDDRALLQDWFTAYEIEALNTEPDRAASLGHERAAMALAGTLEVRLLIRDGVAAAMTGFNAQLAQSVQVGGVYTPPAQRNRGAARAAVALHLEEARGRGIRDAVLFSATEAASRVYELIGFRRVGAYGLAVLKTPRSPTLEVAHG